MFLPISDLLNEDWESNRVISRCLVVSGAVRKPHLPGLGVKTELPNLFFYLHKPFKQGKSVENTRELVKVDLYRAYVNLGYTHCQLPRAKARGLLITSNSDNCLAFVKPTALFGLFLAS